MFEHNPDIGKGGKKRATVCVRKQQRWCPCRWQQRIDGESSTWEFSYSEHFQSKPFLANVAGTGSSSWGQWVNNAWLHDNSYLCNSYEAFSTMTTLLLLWLRKGLWQSHLEFLIIFSVNFKKQYLNKYISLFHLSHLLSWQESKWVLETSS